MISQDQLRPQTYQPAAADISAQVIAVLDRDGQSTDPENTFSHALNID